MRMAKAKVKEKVMHWLSQPILIVVALVMGAIVGALCAFFGSILQNVSDIRDTHPLYWIPGLALAGLVIVFLQEARQRFRAGHGNRL